MTEVEEEHVSKQPTKKQEEEEPKRRRPKKIFIPHRQPSVVIPPKPAYVYTKQPCVTCPCRAVDDSCRRVKRVLPCQRTPDTLYVLAADVLDSNPYPHPFLWTVEEVAEWMAIEVGLPEYANCILDNHIDGLRLLMLEDPSKHPEINIHYFDHIKRITSEIRKLYSTSFYLFARSVSLPPRKPMTHCNWFKSRTGPTWGIRQNWNRSDILRWMKILMPEPVQMNHWDLVWYQKPDFPKVMFARKKKPRLEPGSGIPHYRHTHDVSNEYKMPRKFRILKDIPDSEQVIWLEHRPGSPLKSFLEEQKLEKKRKKEMKRTIKFVIKEDSKLMPKRVKTEGLRGKDLILARRLMPKQKFFPNNRGK